MNPPKPLLRRLSASIGLTLLTAQAQAQIQPGDLLVNYAGGSNTSSVTEYDPSGNVVQSIPDTSFDSFTSVALMPDGRLVINIEYAKRIEIRTSTGALINSFIPQGAVGVGWDVDVFADDTIAICARDYGVKLYDTLGNLVDTFLPAGMVYPFGCQVAIDDSLWVCDRLMPVGDGGRIWHFDRAGTVLGSFDVDYEPSDIVYSTDGTVWISDWDDGRVVHHAADGTELGSFTVQIDSTLKTLWSLALDDQGLIITSGHYDSMVRFYTQAGALVSEYFTAEPGNSTYMVAIEGLGLGTAYCFGDGSGASCPCGNAGGPDEGCANSTGAGATLRALGTPVVAADDLTFEASGLLFQQPALLFAGDNAPGGGSGLPFGDGLRCAGMNVVRLGTQAPSIAGLAFWGPGLSAMGGWAPGDTRYFQVWYRDPIGGPCGSGFNLTQGVQLAFL